VCPKPSPSVRKTPFRNVCGLRIFIAILFQIANINFLTLDVWQGYLHFDFCKLENKHVRQIFPVFSFTLMDQKSLFAHSIRSTERIEHGYV